MKAMTTSGRRLAATLTTTLRAKAAQATESGTATATATAATARFDPRRRPSATSPATSFVDVDVDDLLDHPRRTGRRPADDAGVHGGDGDLWGRGEPGERPGLVDLWGADGRAAGARRRRLVPIAAVVLVAALIGAAVAIRLAGSHDGSVDNGLSVGPAPQGWLMPTWVPEGLDIWNVDWQASDQPTDVADDPFASGTWNSLQLFGDPDAGRALYVQASSEYEADTTALESVTIRGRDGWAGPAVDTALEPVDSIVWGEAGATIAVLIKGMSTEEAIAAVEAMEWRSDDPEQGFAPAGDESLPLRGESLQQRRGIGRSARFVYSDGPPGTDAASDRPVLSIRTSTERDAMPIGYLDDWFYDGDDSEPADDGARHVVDAESHELRVAWPDGREVFVSGDGQMPDRDVLERIVDSVVVATEGDLVPLRERFEANVEGLPVEASAETSIGTVEVHGEGPFHRLCLRRPDEAGLDCGHAPGDVGDVTTSWVIDGTWYVGLAASGVEPQVLDPQGNQALTGETASDRAWRLLLVQPPADAPSVGISTDGTGGFAGLPRPN